MILTYRFFSLYPLLRLSWKLNEESSFLSVGFDASSSFTILQSGLPS